MNGLHAYDRSPRAERAAADRGWLCDAGPAIARAAMRGACRATPIGAAAREAT